MWSRCRKSACKDRADPLHRARSISAFREGEPGNELVAITQGRACVELHRVDALPIRLATFASGTTFSELALVDHQARSGTVVADVPLTCYVLTRESFADMQAREAAIAVRLLVGLGRELPCQPDGSPAPGLIARRFFRQMATRPTTALSQAAGGSRPCGSRPTNDHRETLRRRAARPSLRAACACALHRRPGCIDPRRRSRCTAASSP